MTVSYTAEVATCRGVGAFIRVLHKWKGSVYKLVVLDLVAFLVLYYALNLTYHYLLGSDAKRFFEGVVNYCSFHSNVIPLSFLLGFYVALVMNRWWGQYTTIPSTDPIAIITSAFIPGKEVRDRLIRRTIMRYVCLCLVLVLTMISPRAKKRLPELKDYIDLGLLLESEKKTLEMLNKDQPRSCKHWLPIMWATKIVIQSLEEGRIKNEFAARILIDELIKFRGKASLLLSYDTINIPLVYTQVVTIAVYSYFVTSALGSQWVDNKIKSSDNGTFPFSNIDEYFPIYTTLEFFFYMGWLKVAESLINPFGEDDDDFEVNWLIDRHIQVSYTIVDKMHGDQPDLSEDKFWNEVVPHKIPYAKGTEKLRENHPHPSTFYIVGEGGKKGRVICRRRKNNDAEYECTGTELEPIPERNRWILRRLKSKEEPQDIGNDTVEKELLTNKTSEQAIVNALTEMGGTPTTINLIRQGEQNNNT